MFERWHTDDTDETDQCEFLNFRKIVKSVDY